MESGALEEQQGSTDSETSEESIARVASAEIKSFSALPTQECVSDMISQLVNTFVLLHSLVNEHNYHCCLNKPFSLRLAPPNKKLKLLLVTLSRMVQLPTP